MELGGVQSKTSETYKSYQKSERRIKELNFQRDEDKKNSDRITELAQKLQQKIKVYKKQIEEPKKSPPSILPNTERLNRSSKKLRTGPEWPKEHYLLLANPLDLCKIFAFHQQLFLYQNDLMTVEYILIYITC